jgi:hypothetical protein
MDCRYEILENRLKEEYNTDNSFQGLAHFKELIYNPDSDYDYDSYVSQFTGTKYLPINIINEIQDEIEENCNKLSDNSDSLEDSSSDRSYSLEDSSSDRSYSLEDSSSDRSDSQLDSSSDRSDSLEDSSSDSLEECKLDILENTLYDWKDYNKSFKGLDYFQDNFREYKNYDHYVSEIGGTKYLPNELIKEVSTMIKDECSEWSQNTR